jgi:hypothetical protein
LVNTILEGVGICLRNISTPSDKMDVGATCGERAMFFVCCNVRLHIYATLPRLRADACNRFEDDLTSASRLFVRREGGAAFSAHDTASLVTCQRQAVSERPCCSSALWTQVSLGVDSICE